MLAFVFLFALLLAHHVSMASLGMGGGVSLGIGMLFTSSGTSLSLSVSASLKSRLRLPRTPLSLSPSRGGPCLNCGAASPSASRAFWTALSSFSRPSRSCSSCRVSLPPPVAIAFRSSICFCKRSGLCFARRSLRLAVTSALPKDLVRSGEIGGAPQVLVPFLIALAFSALRWACTGL